MNIRIKKPSIKLLIAVFIAIFILTGVVIAVWQVQKSQDVRQRAAAPAAICAVNQPTDTILLFDKSTSMLEQTSPTDSTPRINKAKQAASAFVDLINEKDTEQNQQMGLVSFASETTSTLDSQLTSNLDAIKTAINNIAVQEETCIECAAKLANDELQARGRQNIKHVAILLTDGRATRYIGMPSGSGTSLTEETYREAERKALDEIRRGNQQYGLVYYTIGFGADVNQQFLRDVASATGGKYFYVPSANELSSVFEEISTVIGQGSISGTAFNDSNRNSIQDQSELPNSSWTINLYDQANQVISTAVTDSSGKYIFDGVCNGTYRIDQVDRSGWTQTLPQNTNGYQITISAGEAIKDQNFGNVQELLACPVNKALCRWDAVSGADSYQVVINEIFPGTTQPPRRIISQTIDHPTTLFPFDAAPGKTYECRVSAQNTCGGGSLGIASDTCPVPPPPTGVPTSTPTVTPTPTAVPTGTIAPTSTPTPTPTSTPTPTPTRTPTPTSTPTPTRIPTTAPTRPAPTSVPSTPTTAVVISTPTNTPIPTVVVQVSPTPRPTIVPTGDRFTGTFVGIAAGILTIVGAVVFFLL